MKTTHTLTTNSNTPERSRLIVFIPALVLMFVFGTVSAFAVNDDRDGRRNGGYTGQEGGYNGPGPELVTVEQAKGMRDDSRVALKGKIIKRLGGEHYEFQDATGTVNVEIDNRRWAGQDVGPDDIVEIRGEVDKERTGTKIDVKQIIKQ